MAVPSQTYVTQTCIKNCGAQILNDGTRQFHNNNVCENNKGRHHVYKSLHVQKAYMLHRTKQFNNPPNLPYGLPPQIPSQIPASAVPQIPQYGLPQIQQSGSINQSFPYIQPPPVPSSSHQFSHRYNTTRSSSSNSSSSSSSSSSMVKKLKEMFPNHSTYYLNDIAVRFGRSGRIYQAVEHILKVQDDDNKDNDIIKHKTIGGMIEQMDLQSILMETNAIDFYINNNLKDPNDHNNDDANHPNNPNDHNNDDADHPNDPTANDDNADPIANDICNAEEW